MNLSSFGRLRPVLVVAAGLALAACHEKPPSQPYVPIERKGSPPVDGTIFPSPGETSFVSANENEQLSSGTSTGPYANSRGAAGEGALDDAAGAKSPPSTANIPSPSNPEPTPDASREIVEDGRTGLVVPPGSIEAWSRALDRVLSDRALQMSLARAAFEKATQYSWARRAERIEDFLGTLA